LGVLSIFLAMTACAPQAVVVQPPPTWPSQVTTQEGIKFYVRGLRIPGTIQDLQLMKGGAKTWIPLSLIMQVRFTGPLHNRYRPAQILLISGETVQGEVFVDFLLGGTTDLGYWNIRVEKIERLDLGTE
jgi:hypothetical protein